MTSRFSVRAAQSTRPASTVLTYPPSTHTSPNPGHRVRAPAGTSRAPARSCTDAECTRPTKINRERVDQQMSCAGAVADLLATLAAVHRLRVQHRRQRLRVTSVLGTQSNSQDVVDARPGAVRVPGGVDSTDAWAGTGGRSERPLSWLNGYRRMTIRYEHRGEHFAGFLQLAAALTFWKKLTK
ncbi:hypothetical protein Rruber_05190 (plasmid) [Rhodococcus ruber]